jgi:pimeloyl-ACP methyl ester carboxylesterase
MLSGDYRVIAVDLYGYGETPMPAKRDDFTLLDEVKLVQSLLDKILLPGEPVHLVGHSYGGAVALRFCHHAPDRVRSATVFEPVAFHLLDREDPGLEPVHAMMQELAGLMTAGEREQAAATFLDYWSGPGSFASFPPRVQKDFAQRTEKLELDFRALTQTQLTLEDYRELLLPVTVIAGRSSRAPALRVAEKLSQTLPDCRLHWVETAHMGPLTDPELVNPIIRGALAR